MKTKHEVNERQKLWADGHGIIVDDQNYVKEGFSNFFNNHLNSETIDELKQGEGKEWSDDEEMRTKIRLCILHLLWSVTFLTTGAIKTKQF